MSLGALAHTDRVVSAARSVRGSLRVPGDKSISHRAALFNALGSGSAHIRHFSDGADCASTVACLQSLGVSMERGSGELVVHGAGLRGLSEAGDTLDCGNSGTSMRLLTGVLAGAGLFAVLSGDGSLRRRPMARVVEPLRAAGAAITGRQGGRFAPLVVMPGHGLRGIEHRLSVASAQVKSALLLAGLFAEGTTTVVEPATTRDHTERLLRAMSADVRSEGSRISIEPAESLTCVDVDVPGDFSSAAFWLVLGVLHPHAEIRVTDVGLNPSRTGLLKILARMGASVRIENRRDVAGEPVGDLVARSSSLHATTVDADLVALAIDEVPLVALLALFADGATTVRGAGELRAKESDRLSVVAEGLSALGGDVQLTADGWIIRPSNLHAARVESMADHRMAMLFALAGAVGRGVEIADADCVSISYPGFWSDLASVCEP